MEQVLHRGMTTGVAAAVATAGLIAIAPAVPPPTVALQQLDVQLTYGAFDAVGQNIQDGLNAIFGASGAFADFFKLDLDGVLWDIHASLYNDVAVAQNLLIGGLGAVLGKTLNGADFLFHIGPGLLPHGLQADPLTDLFTELNLMLQNIGTAVTDLFKLDLVGALQHAFYVFDVAVLEIPAVLTAGTTEFIWSNLLGMP